MQGHEVQLYAILLDGALNRYPKVQVLSEKDMPSGGALSNPNDKALVTALEDKMIEAYGTALVELKCKAAGGKGVHLGAKMLRPQHVGALLAAVERYKVANLTLGTNQLGADGGALLAAALKTNTTLTVLMCAQLGRPSNQGQGFWLSCRRSNARCTGPFHPAFALCAQPRLERPWPRGWHGAGQRPQEKHEPQDARVCCPAIGGRWAGGGSGEDHEVPHHTHRAQVRAARPALEPRAKVGCLARRSHSRCTLALCAQPHGQQPRPRGWHGALQGADCQFDPQEALVCCPAI